MYAIESKRQQFVIGMLSLFFYAITPSLANENVLQRLEKEFQKVVTDARPAVVKVVATQAISVPLSPDDEKLVLTRQDIGSGIVIDTDGHIVTTTFEMDAPSQVEIIFNNGAVSSAELIGTDMLTDIAVLRVAAAPPTNILSQQPETGTPAQPGALSRHKARMSRASKTTTPLKWGDSSKINTGSWVVTIGSSYGHSPIVSFGIVGGRDTLPNQMCGELIKINAAVTPGNSGGAVVNTSGELVGMILAVLTEPPNTTNPAVDALLQGKLPPDITQFLFQEPSQTVRNQEITFAMPMEAVRAIAEEIIEHGKVARGWLGVEVDVSEVGVFVKSVVQGSPAHKGGLLPRDLILEFNEMPIRSYHELLRCVVTKRPSTKIQLKIGRNGAEQQRTVILGEKQ